VALRAPRFHRHKKYGGRFLDRRIDTAKNRQR